MYFTHVEDESKQIFLSNVIFYQNFFSYLDETHYLLLFSNLFNLIEDKKFYKKHDVTCENKLKKKQNKSYVYNKIWLITTLKFKIYIYSESFFQNYLFKAIFWT